MKKLVFGVLAIALAVGFTAFTSQKEKKFAPQTYFLVAGTSDQRIETGFTTAGVEHSVVPSVTFASGVWTTVNQGADSYTSGDGSSYVKSFTIEDASSLSLTDALTGIRNYLASNPYPTTSGSIIINGVTVDNFARADNANQ